MHDAFTISEILTVEALGLVPEGLDLQALADSVSDRTGALPVSRGRG